MNKGKIRKRFIDTFSYDVLFDIRYLDEDEVNITLQLIRTAIY